MRTNEIRIARHIDAMELLRNGSRDTGAIPLNSALPKRARFSGGEIQLRNFPCIEEPTSERWRDRTSPLEHPGRNSVDPSNGFAARYAQRSCELVASRVARQRQSLEEEQQSQPFYETAELPRLVAMRARYAYKSFNKNHSATVFLILTSSTESFVRGSPLKFHPCKSLYRSTREPKGVARSTRLSNASDIRSKSEQRYAKRNSVARHATLFPSAFPRRRVVSIAAEETEEKPARRCAEQSLPSPILESEFQSRVRSTYAL